MGLSVPHITPFNLNKWNTVYFVCFGQKESDIHCPSKDEIITGTLWKLIVSHAGVPGK